MGFKTNKKDLIKRNNFVYSQTILLLRQIVEKNKN